ncbi:MAG: hypothetical protein QNJ46_33965 [Leptolyngbyaceae cyanobacterium MO_188.B28]|nr:hypothetical protein [Leptolyngbyaceae cyanobacterium MO_188.B28]
MLSPSIGSKPDSLVLRLYQKQRKPESGGNSDRDELNNIPSTHPPSTHPQSSTGILLLH